LVDAINPVLNAFDQDAIGKAILPHINRTWELMEKAGNDEDLIYLMEVFWFFKPTETLLIIKSRIHEMNEELVEISRIKFEADSFVPVSSLLSLLSLFSHMDVGRARIAVVLLLSYIAWRPKDIPFILHILTEDFGFKHISYIHNFVIQKMVIEELWEHTSSGADYLHTKLFLFIGKQYLHTHFHELEMKGKITYTIHKCTLPPTNDVFELRRVIWTNLFELFNVPMYQAGVLAILHSYRELIYPDPVKDIIAQDMKNIIPFINSKLDSINYYHCLIVNDYLEILDELRLTYDVALRDKFTNEAYRITKMLFIDRLERRKLKELQKLRREKIIEYFDGFNYKDYENFFELCLEIKETLDFDNNGYQLEAGIAEVFEVIAEKDQGLYLVVLEHYLNLGNPFDLNPLSLTGNLLKICGAQYTYDVLSKLKYPGRRTLLFSYYHSLPPSEITNANLNRLYDLYREAEFGEIPRDFDLLLKYRSLDDDVVINVVEIILGKVNDDPSYAYPLSMLFNPYSDVNKVIIDIFTDRIDPLERAYFAAQRIEQYLDHDGVSFARILEKDPDFILKYVDIMCEGKEWPNRYDDTRDYSFIWLRDDSEELMVRVTERIYEAERKHGASIAIYLKTFFILRKEKISEGIKIRQNDLLNTLIERRCNEPDFMKFIFGLISFFSPKKRLQFVAVFLEYNKDFDIFQRLPLEPNHWGWSGSAVPMHQKRMEYLNSLLSLLNTVDFLQHKQYIERLIQGLQVQIEHEKKKDFIGDRIPKNI
jgi:hypothetical protein